METRAVYRTLYVTPEHEPVRLYLTQEEYGRLCNLAEQNGLSPVEQALHIVRLAIQEGEDS